MVTSVSMSLKREIKKFLNLIRKPYDKLSQRNSISVNLICYNNIKSIETCLKSIEKYVDEIIVIDGGSDDGSIDVLKKFGVDLSIEKNWQGYAHQRNLALAKTKTDWIFKLDSDEILGTDLAKNLKELCSSEIFYAYKIYSRWILNENPSDNKLAKKNYIDSSKNPETYYVPIRLFRNIYGISWQKEVHEYISGFEEYYKKKLNKHLCIYHLDTLINSFEDRFKKVIERNRLYPGSGHAEEYLPELFDNPRKAVPERDLELMKL
jgi:glycosyltransferase involved in cell wall biosynthesis